ncbi:response regulator [Croceibacterium sp. TMG7-5b_MA50]|uniref:response regulator n=1 Tax=Croceibacterium sp. TMG7-5b_MA50 TaxID=3121290 RepID=UPI003222222F
MIDGLTGKRVLIVEDEFYIASNLRRSLHDLGAIVIGPAPDLATALPLAEEALDAAVLDVNLDYEQSFPVADRLRERGIPFLLLTGYDAWALPESYQDAPRLAKPFATNAVATMLEQVMAPPLVSLREVSG